MTLQHIKSNNSKTDSDSGRLHAPHSKSFSLVSGGFAAPSSPPLPIPDPKSEHCKLFIYNLILSIVLVFSYFPPHLISAARKKRKTNGDVLPTHVILNGICIIEPTHRLMMIDSKWYSNLYEQAQSCGDSSIYVSLQEYKPKMVNAYVTYFEDMKMFDEFRYSDTKGFFDFIDFLDKIFSKSLGDVMEFMVADEVCEASNSNLIRQLTNYQEEQAMGTEISVYEKMMLDHYESQSYLIRNFIKSVRSLTPITYSFKNELYILLKIKLFGYTVLKSVNATWFVVDTGCQSRIVRMKPRTILEHTADELDIHLHCRVENVYFPTAYDDHAFNLCRVEMCYKIEVAVADEVDSDESLSSEEEEDDDEIDPNRADGGGQSYQPYYVGGSVFNKYMGWIKHGRGCMYEYPDDSRRVPIEENGNGIYIHNEHYCEGDCDDLCKFCHCKRDVGKESAESDSDSDSDSDLTDDYHRCAIHESKEEICTNLEEDTIELHHYCNPCAENVEAIKDVCLMPYLQRLFKELTGKSFVGDWAELCAFFDMINPYESAYVRSIETYEDYVSLLMPTDQVICKRDMTLQEKISAYFETHK